MSNILSGTEYNDIMNRLKRLESQSPTQPPQKQHVNELSQAQLERLAYLIEECGEVIQAATKIIRHGYKSYNPDDSMHKGNRDDLAREMADVNHAMNLIIEFNDVNQGDYEVYAIKIRSMKHFHYNNDHSEK